jgi:hypothetical protein
MRRVLVFAGTGDTDTEKLRLSGILRTPISLVYPSHQTDHKVW